MALGELIDVSRSGLRVTSPRQLPLNTKVEVLLENTRFLGDVRNCVRRASNQFDVGIGNAQPNSIARRVYDPMPPRSKQ